MLTEECEELIARLSNSIPIVNNDEQVEPEETIN
jgi:hypothetical protein